VSVQVDLRVCTSIYECARETYEYTREICEYAREFGMYERQSVNMHEELCAFMSIYEYAR
jgi:hypothetical protein